MTKSTGGEGRTEGTMTPFADDEATLTIGGFTIENGSSCVSMSGSLDVTKDEDGLAKARELKNVIDAVVSALEGASDLPDKVAEDAGPKKTVKNPFA